METGKLSHLRPGARRADRGCRRRRRGLDRLLSRPGPSSQRSTRERRERAVPGRVRQRPDRHGPRAPTAAGFRSTRRSAASSATRRRSCWRYPLGDLTVPGEATVRVDESEETRSEARYLRADGTPLWVAVSTTLVRGADRRPLYYVLQVEDIGDHEADRARAPAPRRPRLAHGTPQPARLHGGATPGAPTDGAEGRVRGARPARSRQLQDSERHGGAPRRRPGTPRHRRGAPAAPPSH